MSDYQRDDDSQPREFSTNSARDRVNLPSIFLIVVGIMNVIGGLPPLAMGIFVEANPEWFVKQNAEKKMFDMPPPDAEQYRQAGLFYLGAGVVGILGGILVTVAGVCMRSFRAYGLAAVGAVAACIPCLSPMACCGIGIGIGIWALVVLMNPEVQAAFGMVRE